MSGRGIRGALEVAETETGSGKNVNEAGASGGTPEVTTGAGRCEEELLFEHWLLQGMSTKESKTAEQ